MQDQNENPNGISMMYGSGEFDLHVTYMGDEKVMVAKVDPIEIEGVEGCKAVHGRAIRSEDDDFHPAIGAVVALGRALIGAGEEPLAQGQEMADENHRRTDQRKVVEKALAEAMAEMDRRYDEDLTKVLEFVGACEAQGVDFNTQWISPVGETFVVHQKSDRSPDRVDAVITSDGALVDVMRDMGFEPMTFEELTSKILGK